MESHRTALKIHRSIGARRGEANALNNIGSLLAEKGDHELALESYAAAKAVYEAIGAKNMVSQVNKNVAVAKAALRDGGAKL